MFYNVPTIEEIEHRLERLKSIYAKNEKGKSEILAKTDNDKRELILWIIGLFIGFSTINITAVWAILSFAVK